MYWQVYIHKTVLVAEMMLVMIIRRAKELISGGAIVEAATIELNFFLHHSGSGKEVQKHLDIFCRLDDHDVMATIKNWCHHPDKILSVLCRCLVERKLLKISFRIEPFDPKEVEDQKKITSEKLQVSGKDAGYFVFTGETSITTYDPKDERINILFKDGTVRDISKVDNALIHQDLSSAIKKYYFCYYRW